MVCVRVLQTGKGFRRAFLLAARLILLPSWRVLRFCISASFCRQAVRQGGCVREGGMDEQRLSKGLPAGGQAHLAAIVARHALLHLSTSLQTGGETGGLCA